MATATKQAPTMPQETGARSRLSAGITKLANKLSTGHSNSVSNSAPNSDFIEPSSPGATHRKEAKQEPSASQPHEQTQSQDHKESIIDEVPSEIWKHGGDEAVTRPAAEKGIGGHRDDMTYEDFEPLRILGTGTFARVWQVRIKKGKERRGEEGNVYALKVLRKDQVVKLKQIDHVKNERAILGDVAGHPFITTLVTTFSDRDCLYMLLEYCPGGEIFSYLRKQKRFSEAMARFYICEIVLVLEFLHEKEGVAYRDLKPENILLDAQGHVKLVDFGFAKRVKDRETYTLCGTPEYLAPEVIQSQGHTTAVDWWALGILIYEFITGYPPFWHSNPMEIYKQILHKPVSFPDNSSNFEPLTDAAKDLIRGLLAVDRSKRLGNLAGRSSDVKNHPWFTGVDWDDIYNRRIEGPIIPALKGDDDASCFERYDMEEKTGIKQGGVKEGDYHGEWDGVFDDF